MSLYGLKEIAIIALMAGMVMAIAPQHFWLAMGVVLVGYMILSLTSAQAFRKAVSTGFVREPRYIAGSRRVFFIAQGCPSRWLVKRYIRVSPR
ncbi:MAG: hypothetical protein BGO63_10555 [Candidatus Accumulibacter sp. 66-26]|nr:MAG: hypothetical protein BGO63_10555 [Candidatus Accumulibacter sp. 66-26]